MTGAATGVIVNGAGEAADYGILTTQLDDALMVEAGARLPDGRSVLVVVMVPGVDACPEARKLARTDALAAVMAALAAKEG